MESGPKKRRARSSNIISSHLRRTILPTGDKTGSQTNPSSTTGGGTGSEGIKAGKSTPVKKKTGKESTAGGGRAQQNKASGGVKKQAPGKNKRKARNGDDEGKGEDEDEGVDDRRHWSELDVPGFICVRRCPRTVSGDTTNSELIWVEVQPKLDRESLLEIRIFAIIV